MHVIYSCRREARAACVPLDVLVEDIRHADSVRLVFASLGVTYTLAVVSEHSEGRRWEATASTLLIHVCMLLTMRSSCTRVRGRGSSARSLGGHHWLHEKHQESPCCSPLSTLNSFCAAASLISLAED